jgi:hypothetical protein
VILLPEGVILSDRAKGPMCFGVGGLHGGGALPDTDQIY